MRSNERALLSYNLFSDDAEAFRLEQAQNQWYRYCIALLIVTNVRIQLYVYVLDQSKLHIVHERIPC